MTEQLNRVMVPVLLGSNAKAIRIAHMLYLRYDVVSHLYSTRPVLLPYLLSYVRVVRVPDYMQGELLCRDLVSFAAEYPDLLFCLIPCTEQGKAFCMAYTKELEPYYIIPEPEQLCRGTLSYLTKEELPI